MLRATSVVDCVVWFETKTALLESEANAVNYLNVLGLENYEAVRRLDDYVMDSV